MTATTAIAPLISQTRKEIRHGRPYFSWFHRCVCPRCAALRWCRVEHVSGSGPGSEAS
jgi:hypothetical protein